MQEYACLMFLSKTLFCQICWFLNTQKHVLFSDISQILTPPSQSLDGLGVVFQVLMPEDSGSNPEAGSIYSFDEVCPGLGLLQPQWNPYPTLTPPSCWVRHVRSIGDPQYGLVVCCVDQHTTPRTRGRFPMMVIHHFHFTSNFLH